MEQQCDNYLWIAFSSGSCGRLIIRCCVFNQKLIVDNHILLAGHIADGTVQ